MLVILLVFSDPAWSLSRDYYSSEKLPKTWAKLAHKRWMSGLSNNVKFSALSIPGTHDMCSLYGGDLVKTQA